MATGAVEFPSFEPPYTSPVHVKAYIRDWWLDDVVEVSYQAQDQKTPVFGFKSQFWDGVFMGQTYVAGRIVTLFRYPGYLTKVLDALLSPEAKDSLKHKGTGVPMTERTLPASDAKTMLQNLAQRDPQAFRQAGHALKDIVYKNRSAKNAATDAARREEKRRPGLLQAAENRRFDLRLVYGRQDGNLAYRFEQVLEDVLLTGQGQEISILEGSGDACLFEAYSFIARNVS